MSTTKQLQRLPVQFSKNGLPYRLLQRNDIVVVYGVGGKFYPNKLHYEVVRIIHVPEREIMGKIVPAHEAMPSNEQFGKEGSRCIVERDRAEEYFQELSEKLKHGHKGTNGNMMEEKLPSGKVRSHIDTENDKWNIK